MNYHIAPYIDTDSWKLRSKQEVWFDRFYHTTTPIRFLHHGLSLKPPELKWTRANSIQNDNRFHLSILILNNDV